MYQLMNTETLDEIHTHIQTQPQNVHFALSRLEAFLGGLRNNLPPAQWKEAIATCRDHPLRDVLHQDPLTARAFSMSRGYQGDAELLDIIYDGDYRPFSALPVTPLGEQIFSYTIACKAPSAVRERRIFLATQIDAFCAASPSAHILSVACGHLRELEESTAIQSAGFGRFVGFDQDPATLAVVAESWKGSGVECRLESVKNFLAAPAPEKFDFIYSAGLYDYLDDQAAKYVTERLFNMLSPSGRLLIGNYTPENDEIGYMEAYMGWHLIYRDKDTMKHLTEKIASESIKSVKIYPDSTGIVMYLDITAK